MVDKATIQAGSKTMPLRKVNNKQWKDQDKNVFIAIFLMCQGSL